MDIALSVRLCHSDLKLSKSQRASKPHQWFKSYGHFTEGVILPIGGVGSGKGLRLQPVKDETYRRAIKHIIVNMVQLAKGLYLL